MRRADVEKYLYEKVIKKFDKWMRGQTVGRYEDGSIDYYEHDVERFISSHLEGEPTYFD